jgi:nucleotide-binding universal stress UspA family protein
MFKLKSILFPIEFSQRDEAAAPFVLSMAQRYHARVVLFHVVQPPPPLYAGMNVVYPETYDFTSVISDIVIDLRKFAEAQLPKVDVECVAECGDPATTISQYACSKGVDLIAMPTHGYGLFRRALLGSITSKVLHDSTIPVWTSAHAPEPSHRAHPQPRLIVCAVDMKPEGQRTVDVALELASDAGAQVEILHLPGENVRPEAAARHLEDLVSQTQTAEAVDIGEVAPIATTQPESHGASVAHNVRTLALLKRADLVVIGRGAIRNGFGSLYANSYDIIRESPCPVLSV